MPCYDDRNENELKIVKERLDLATRVACKVLRSLESRGIFFATDKEIEDWWAEHKGIDAKRERK